MRSTLLLALALLTTTLAFPADASGPVGPTIFGPTNIPAARNWSYSGQLVVEATGAPVMLYGQTIGLYLNGIRVAEGETDAQGKYLVQVSFPVGTHTLQARAFEGSAMEEGSPVLTVRSYPTWPAGPADIQVVPGFLWSHANLSWNYPWTDGGYPITSWRFDRSTNGGPYVTVYNGSALKFVDTNVTPGASYAYKGYATTSYATSNHTARGYVANGTVALVSLVSYRVCDNVVCATLTGGENFTTNASVNVSIDLVTASGVIDTWPVSGPGLAGRIVRGDLALASGSDTFQATSDAAGAWSFAFDRLFSAQAPGSGCASVALDVYARPEGLGRDVRPSGFQLCVLAPM